MSEFENRLAEMLAERADGAPTAEGLASAARSRQRRRRAAHAALGAGAVVAAVVAVPVGLGALSTDDGQGPVSTQPLPEVRGLPADWRWESYHDLEFLVPQDWGYGPLSQYCIGSNSRPVVERPGGVSTEVACPTPLGYGALVSVEGTAPTLDNTYVPQGAAFGQTTAGGVTLTVVAKSQEVVDDILSSAKVYPGADYYGCEAEAAVPALGAMTAQAEYDAAAPVSLCRYEVGVEGANLIESEALVDPNDLESFSLGITSAQPGTGPDAEAKDCSGWAASQALLVRQAGQDVAWVHYDGCTGHGLDLGGTTYQLDAQLTYWALPRGGFGVDGSVPLPKETRH